MSGRHQPTNTLFGTKRLIGRRFDEATVEKEMKMVSYKVARGPSGDAWLEANVQSFHQAKLHVSF